MEKTDLAWEERQLIISEFYAWFCEQEGYHIREERFWDAVERQDDQELLQWLKVAYKLGYLCAKQHND